jgi:hypothetical protein
MKGGSAWVVLAWEAGMVVGCPWTHKHGSVWWKERKNAILAEGNCRRSVLWVWKREEKDSRTHIYHFKAGLGRLILPVCDCFRSDLFFLVGCLFLLCDLCGLFLFFSCWDVELRDWGQGSWKGC